MEKKYELVKDDGIIIGSSWLYRIRALKHIQISANLYMANIKPGDLGGYVESEDNLSHEGTCWVNDDAKVYGKAFVYENACITGNASVFGHAKVYGNAFIGGKSIVRDSAMIHEDAHITGHALICDLVEVYGDTLINKYAVVSQRAKIYDNVIVTDSVCITGDAEVRCKAHIYGNTTIAMRGLIERNSEYACVSGFCSVNRTTTFYLSVDRKTILVNCGCFNGTIDEFRNWVNETYSDNGLGKEYLDLANLMEKRFKRIVKNRKEKEEAVINQYIGVV